MKKAQLTNSLKYFGTVRLKHDDVVLCECHNEGKDALFEAFERAIAGQSILNYVPVMIRAVYLENNYTERPFLKYNLQITAKTFVPSAENSSTHCVRFSTTIRNSDKQETIPNNANVKLELLTDNEVVLADIVLDTTVSQQFNLTTPQQRIILEWELRVRNE